MAKQILIKPLLSDKSTRLAETPTQKQYTFVVNREANKIEIKKAVEEQFNVTVLAVNTSVRPGKKKSRVVKGRMTAGRTAPIKKAFVTIAPGQIIEGFYGDAAAEVETPEAESTEAAAQ